MDPIGILFTLVVGSFGFTAGGYVYTYRVEKKIANHLTTRVKRLEKHLGLPPTEDNAASAD